MGFDFTAVWLAKELREVGIALFRRCEWVQDFIPLVALR